MASDSEEEHHHHHHHPLLWQENTISSGEADGHGSVDHDKSGITIPTLFQDRQGHGRKLFLFNNKDSFNTPNLSVKTINEPGFGDLANQYAFGMASFKGHLYVGTLNAPQMLWDVFVYFPSGIDSLLGTIFEFESNGAKIYRGIRSPESGGWTWEMVLDFANTNAKNYGVRKMVVINEFLYMVTANHRDGLEVWKTFTGDIGSWTRVDGQSGFGDEENSSGRGMEVCGNYLYVGAENRKTGAQIWRTKLLSDGDIDNTSSWEEIMPESRGFGKSSNYFVADFVLYKGSFYAGTLNGFNGMELWRTNMCNETFPSVVKFDKVFDGGKGNRLEFGILSMININDKALVLGTVNYLQGASLYIDIGGSGSDTNFQPIFKRGYGNRFNSYMWSLEYYNGRLYVGTMHNLGLFVPWSTFQLFSVSFDENMLEVTDVTKESTIGFGFFGPWGQVGIRNMQVHNGSLIIGTAGNKLLSGTIVFEAISKE